MHVGADHWLVTDEEGLPEVTRSPSTRTCGIDVGPLGIVWHWTGGVCRGPNAHRILADEIRTYEPAKDRAASWHVIIAKDGRMIQSVPLNLGSWHVGRPGRLGGKPKMTNGAWDATLFEGRLFANINRGSVGVELLNAGRLEKVGEKFYTSPYWLHPDDPPEKRVPNPALEIEAERSVWVAGGFYDEYPDAQVQAATRLMQALALKYKILREGAQYGHVMFDPKRKEDPGPLWLEQKLPAVLDRVFGPE